MDPTIDLSMASLMRACKGNVATLPSFMVHDDPAWPRGNVVQADSKGRIHMRRSTFLRVVAGKLPIRAGLWHRIDCQEFHLDLQPHHLQGSEDQRGGNRKQAARAMAVVDAFGRAQGDQDYGVTPPRHNRQQDVARDVADAKARGTSRSIRSTVLGGSGRGES